MRPKGIEIDTPIHQSDPWITNLMKKINLIPSVDDRYPPEPACFVLENVFTPEKCMNWIEFAESVGYSPALIDNNGTQEYAPEMRNHSRAMLDDPTLALDLFNRIRPHLPYDDEVSRRAPKKLNPRLRFLKYHPGEYFRPHMDNCYEDETDDTISVYTVQLYLNDTFTGGETIFIEGGSIRHGHPIAYSPKQGSVLVFHQDTYYHEGAEVTSGMKRCVRTEVMYDDQS